jgi:hypothetical protein
MRALERMGLLPAVWARSSWKLWLRNQIWRTLPHTPWKNMMLEIPLKAANSICLQNY